MILYWWFVRVVKECLIFFCRDLLYFKVWFVFGVVLFFNIFSNELFLFLIKGVFMDMWWVVIFKVVLIFFVGIFNIFVSFFGDGFCLYFCLSLENVLLILFKELILFNGRWIIWDCLVNVCKIDWWIYYMV